MVPREEVRRIAPALRTCCDFVLSAAQRWKDTEMKQTSYGAFSPLSWNPCSCFGMVIPPLSKAMGPSWPGRKSTANHAVLWAAIHTADWFDWLIVRISCWSDTTVPLDSTTPGGCTTKLAEHIQAFLGKPGLLNTKLAIRDKRFHEAHWKSICQARFSALVSMRVHIKRA